MRGERLSPAGAWVLIATLFALVAITLPELGSDPWHFRPPSVDPQGPRPERRCGVWPESPHVWRPLALATPTPCWSTALSSTTVADRARERRTGQQARR